MLRLSALFALFLCVTLGQPPKVWGQHDVINFHKPDEAPLIGNKAAFLEDPTGNLRLQDVLERKFTPVGDDVFARPASRSAFWFKITLSNQTQEDVWLEVGTSAVWELDFYAPDDFGVYGQPFRTGTMRPRDHKFHDINWFWLPLNKAGDVSPKTYYLRVIENKVSLQVPLRVGTFRKLSKHKDVRDFISAGFAGAMIVMFLYNFFIYVSTKQTVYFYYLGYLLSALFFITYLQDYFILDDFSWVDVPWFFRNFIAWSAPIYLFTGLFCISYLHLGPKRLRIPYWIIIGHLIALCGLFPVLNLVFGLDAVAIARPYNITILSLYLTCLTTAYVLAIRGERQAQLYALGWTFLIIALFIYVATLNGLFPFTLFTYNIMYFGVTLEVWVFSLALGDRINRLRRQNLNLIREQNRALESKVRKRTEELETTNEELAQQQEELRVMNDTLSNTNKDLKETTKQVRDSIRAAESIQQAILPHKHKVDHCLNDYFVLYRPRDVVSGDFFWVHQQPDGAVILVVADCTGHGVPGAFMTLIGHNLLDKVVRVYEKQDPAAILEALDEEVKEALQQHETRDSSGMDVGILRIDPSDKGQIHICFAGAKRPLYYVRPGSAQLDEIKGTVRAVGGRHRKKRAFTRNSRSCPAGTVFYLGSDGYADQNDAQRIKFGSLRLKDLLHQVAPLPMQEQKKRLEEALDQHRGDESQRDDILWVGVRF